MTNPYREIGEVQDSPFHWEPCNVNSMRSIIGRYLFRIAPMQTGCKLVIYVTPDDGPQKRFTTIRCINTAAAIGRAKTWFLGRDDHHLWM